MENKETFPRLRELIERAAQAEKDKARTIIDHGIYRDGYDDGIKRYLTPRMWQKYMANEITREKAAELATARAFRKIDKTKEKRAARLSAAASAPRLSSASVSVAYSRAGAAHATFYDDEIREGHAYGWGYDKASAALADAFSKSPTMDRLLFELAENALESGKSPRTSAAGTSYDWRDCIAYGAGWGPLPYFAGGVGISCFWEIIALAGYKVRQVVGKKDSATWLIGF